MDHSQQQTPLKGNHKIISIVLIQYLITIKPSHCYRKSFFCFNNSSNNETWVDSGATINIVTPNTVLTNETLTPNGPLVISVTKDIMQARLPTKSRIAHKMPVIHNLLSLDVLADDNMVSILDKNKIIVCKDDAVQIFLSEAPVLTEQRAPNGLWKVPIIPTTTPINANIKLYY